MLDVKTRRCFFCDKDKVFNTVRLGGYDGIKIQYRYVDENDKMWAGNVCPDCKNEHNHLKYTKDARKRGKAKVTNRKCRVCNESLSSKYYFRCGNCTVSSVVTEFEDEFIYNY